MFRLCGAYSGISVPRHSGRSARFPSRARIPRMRESPLKSGGVALESARGEPESRLPFKSRRRGGRRHRKSPNRKPQCLDGTRTPAFQKFEARTFRLAPFAKTRQSLDSGSPRSLAGKKRRISKRLRERSKILSSDNRARSGRNDGPLENPRSRRTAQTESRHSGKEQNPAEKLSAIPGDFHHPSCDLKKPYFRFFTLVVRRIPPYSNLITLFNYARSSIIRFVSAMKDHARCRPRRIRRIRGRTQ